VSSARKRKCFFSTGLSHKSGCRPGRLRRFGHGATVHCVRSRAVVSDVLIPPDSGLLTTPRPGWNGGIYDFMRGVSSSEHGKALYRQRQHLIESLFGSIKHNRGFKQLPRRGRAAVRTEWRLITATHNLLKLHQHHIATAAA
jgi:hypothetical protein